jgi:hypothetical protein
LKFLDRIFGPTLSPAWEVSPGGIVWKLQPTAGGILAGESRDVERRTVSLFALRHRTGDVLFRDRTLEEPWWIALEMTIGEIAILHRYPRPDLPNALGAVAIDATTGEILWENETVRIICGLEEVGLAQRGESIDSPSLLFVDLRSGAVIEQIEEIGRAREFQALCSAGEGIEGWTGSEEIDAASAEGRAIIATAGIKAEELRGSIESAEHGAYTVASLHLRSRRSANAMLAGRVDNMLLVIRDGRVLYRETAVPDAPAPSSDLFFIWNGVLTFIREGRTIVGIELRENVGARS